jgi:uncharacterized cupin superfamily protein
MKPDPSLTHQTASDRDPEYEREKEEPEDHQTTGNQPYCVSGGPESCHGETENANKTSAGIRPLLPLGEAESTMCGKLAEMVPEADVEQTEHGLVPSGEGWYVLNARDARWRHADGRGAIAELEGEPEFPQLGVNVFVLGAGEPMSMYHWEADQEDFLVLAGEALLIVEGEERPLRQWDFVHCPAGTKHTLVGAHGSPTVVLAVGAREHQTGAGWGGYTVDEAALRHHAGVADETNDPEQAYAPVPGREQTRYREGWLPP